MGWDFGWLLWYPLPHVSLCPLGSGLGVVSMPGIVLLCQIHILRLAWVCRMWDRDNVASLGRNTTPLGHVVPMLPRCEVRCAPWLLWLGEPLGRGCNQRLHSAVNKMRDWGLDLSYGEGLVWFMYFQGGGPSSTFGSSGILKITQWWSGTWMCWFHVQLRCGDVLLMGIVGSPDPWIWVIFGGQGRIHCPVACTLTWSLWWVCAHGALWIPILTRFLSISSWVGPEVCFYHDHISLKDICFPCWRWRGIFLLDM